MLHEAFAAIHDTAPLSEALHSRLWEEFKLYLATGGLPEVVSTFMRNSDIANYFFPGPIAGKLRNKALVLCRRVNQDTLRHLSALFSLAMDTVSPPSTVDERVATVREGVREADHRLLQELLALRQRFELYTKACAWAARLHLGSPADIDGPVFERVFDVHGSDTIPP